MSNTIAELWNGALEPLRHFGKGNLKMKQLEHLMQFNLEQLESVLDEKEKKLFGKYNDAVNEYLVVTNEQAFCDGFSFGTKITAEAMTEAEHLL